MRVSTEQRKLDVPPGGTSDVQVEVINTSAVIDGFSARLIGLNGNAVSSRPEVLPLFPDSAGRINLRFSLPSSFPAGTHALTVEVQSHTQKTPPAHVDMDMVVAPFAQLDLVTHPGKKTGYRRASFTVELTNSGNVPLDVALTCNDPDRALQFRLSEPSITVAPSQVVRVQLNARAGRHLFGNEIDKPFRIHAEALATEPHRALLGDNARAQADVQAILRQKPRIARGLLTVLILASVVALWAGAFLLGLTKVFGSDPLTKSAPASFFVSQSALKGLVGQSVPEGLLAKGGPLPPGVGGVISGRVEVAHGSDGVGRIVVEAIRRSTHGLQTVATAATGSDGSYAVIGLFPDDYLLRFSAPGYHTVWSGGATSAAKARPITASPQIVTKTAPVHILGFPATITGTVDPGSTTVHPKTRVTLRPLSGLSNKPIAHTVTNKHGNYRLPKVPAPAQYELTFTTKGYLATTITDNVGGGEHRFEPVVRLSAGAGTISGTVTDGTKPIGGVTVSTSVDGQTFSTGTPTVGAIGHFSLTGLPTPGTYILTFSRDAATSTNQIVDLGPGRSKTLKHIKLIGGTNAVLGTVTDSTAAPLGGATVTVGGIAVPLSTTTLTDGAGKGQFILAGLPTPGNYTLTVSLAGYQPSTVPLSLDGVHAPKPQAISLMSALGQVSGVVRAPDGSGGFTPSIGATVTITDGINVSTTTTVDSADPAERGGFTLTNLPPGHYSITAAHSGYAQMTALVDVTVGGPGATIDLDLKPAT
jgi:hypothetical protein